MPALGRLRQENYLKFEANLDHSNDQEIEGSWETAAESGRKGAEAPSPNTGQRTLLALGTYHRAFLHYALAPDSSAPRMVSTLFRYPPPSNRSAQAWMQPPTSPLARFLSRVQDLQQPLPPLWTLNLPLTSNLSLLVAGRCNAELAPREEGLSR